MENKIFGFGIVGCGAISSIHIKAINGLNNAKPVGVFDANEARAIQFANEHGIKAFKTYEEMLACPEIDVVNICTPSGLHAPLLLKATEAGKHVVVEKPLAITEEELCAIEKSSEENSAKVCVISQLRFSPAIQTIKKAIADGKFGKIVYATLIMRYNRDEEYYASSNWRGTWAMDGGGALMNQGIHGIDMLINLLGDVKTVCGIAKTNLRKIEVEDSATILAEFKSGAMVTVAASVIANPPAPRTLEIHGTHGRVVITESTVVECYSDLDDNIIETALSTSGGHIKPLDIPFENHMHQIEEFLDAIVNNREPVINAHEGAKSVRMILATYKSSKEKRIIDME